jgi:UPF0716 protein FxsA
MLRVVLLLLLLLPVLELALLFKLAAWMGWIPTLLLVLGAGVAGTALVRYEGLRTAARVREQMAQGVLPTAEMFDGLLLAAAGLLLVLPGVASDALALVLVVPPTRKLVRRGLMHWVRTHVRMDVIRGGPGAGDEPRSRPDEIIDARVVETRVVD